LQDAASDLERIDGLNNPDDWGAITSESTCADGVGKPASSRAESSLVYQPELIIAFAKLGITLVFFLLSDIEKPGNRFETGVQMPQIAMLNTLQSLDAETSLPTEISDLHFLDSLP
jgi:hypothetical protein